MIIIYTANQIVIVSLFSPYNDSRHSNAPLTKLLIEAPSWVLPSFVLSPAICSKTTVYRAYWGKRTPHGISGLGVHGIPGFYYTTMHHDPLIRSSLRNSQLITFYPSQGASRECTRASPRERSCSARDRDACRSERSRRFSWSWGRKSLKKTI